MKERLGFGSTGHQDSQDASLPALTLTRQCPTEPLMWRSQSHSLGPSPTDQHFGLRKSLWHPDLMSLRDLCFLMQGALKIVCDSGASTPNYLILLVCGELAGGTGLGSIARRLSSPLHRTSSHLELREGAKTPVEKILFILVGAKIRPD